MCCISLRQQTSMRIIWELVGESCRIIEWPCSRDTKKTCADSFWQTRTLSVREGKFISLFTDFSFYSSSYFFMSHYNLIFSSDGKIIVHDRGSEYSIAYNGHNQEVNCVDCKGGVIVSGSRDRTAKVRFWTLCVINTLTCIHTPMNKHVSPQTLHWPLFAHCVAFNRF